MDPQHWQRVCALFDRARVASPPVREALLAEAGELRDEVEELLRQHEAEAGALSSRADLLAPGTRVGAYEVEQPIGTGGMGTVYRARDASHGVVALKMLHPHLRADAQFVERFRREAALGMRIAHPNVVRTLGTVGDAGLVLELIEGQTLGELARELGQVSEELCRHLGREIAFGLAAIHEAGVVHRDLKPGNVLLTPEHEVKLTDLGVALSDSASVRLSMTGQFLGTLLYSAPEQLTDGAAALDGRADLYALGIVLYELSAGCHPITAEDFRAVVSAHLEGTPRRLGDVNPQVSPFFEEVVHTLLAKRPDDRFASAEALARVLAEGEDGAWWAERAEALRARTQRPLRRIRVPRETAVYGRDAQLARLEARFEAAAGGRAQVVLLEGEAGIGKTRLVDELWKRLQEQGHDPTFLHGSYPPGGAATPTGALRAAFLEALGGEGLESRLAAYLPDTPQLVPAFAAQLRGDAPPPGAAPLTQVQRRDVYSALARAMANERPLVLTIDDLHFAPREGRELFAALAASAGDAPLLLIGTARPGLPVAWRAELDRLDPFERIAVERLGPKELTRLLVDALGSRQVAERLAFPVAEKSDGNPFFVFEIVRSLKESGLLRRDEDGSWTTSGRIQRIRVPDSVRELMRARIAGLTESDQEILDVAACLGVSFDPGLVAEVLGLARIPLLRALGRLERDQRLVRAAGREFVFDHHQIHEALYEGQSESLRREYHGAIGRALAAPHGDTEVTGETAWRICEHLVRGGDVAAALPYLDATVDHLWQRFQHDEALDLYRQLLDQPGALTGARRVQVLHQRAEHLQILGELEAARVDNDEAQRIADEDGDVALRMRAVGARAWGLKLRGQREASMALYDELYVLAESIDHRRAMASAVGNQAGLHGDAGRYDLAEEVGRRYLQMVEELGDEQGVMSGVGNLASHLFHQGKLDEAVACYERHLELCEKFGDLMGATLSICGIANVHSKRGDHDLARDGYERALALAVRTQNRLTEVRVLTNLGLTLSGAEDHAGARDRLVAALRLAEELGMARSELLAAYALGSSYAWTGEYDEAAALFERASALAETVGVGEFHMVALRERAILQERRGDAEGADTLYRQALACTTGTTLRRLECEAEYLGFLRERTPEPALTARIEEFLRGAEALDAAQLRCTALAWLGRREEARRAYEAVRAELGPVARWETLHAIGTSCDDAESLAEARAEALAYLEPLPPEHRARVAAHASVLPQLLGTTGG